MPTPTRRLRRTFVLLTVCTLAVFATLLFGLTAVLRQRLRAEVLQREVEAVQSVALMQVSSAQARLDRLGVEISTPDIFTAVLESSRLRGVLAVQLFDDQGSLRDSLPAVSPSVAEHERWWPVPLAQGTARFHPHGALEEVFGVLPDSQDDVTRTPLLEIVVPLAANGGSLGVARYWVDGTPLAAEFSRMDRNLFAQAGVGFLGGALLVTLLLAWTYRRLAHAQEELLQHRADLERANQELDFAAKTGALGAISAHLIHGLKNPLAGLEGFVAEAASADEPTLSGEARQTAVETAARLRALVNEVVAVLRDEATGGADYAVPVREVIDAVRHRTAPTAAQAGVSFDALVSNDAQLNARVANLAGLVLANLLTNAIEASAAGGGVAVEAIGANGAVQFLVSDHGPGLPTAIQQSLFRPVMSTKRGGGGMGLAISHRLARHAGGELTLVRSDAAGTVFRLQVPAV